MYIPQRHNFRLPQAAVKCGVLGGFAVTGGALLAFSTMYTLTSLGRSDSRTTFRGYSCGGGKSGTVSQKVFIPSFCKSQFPHKSVNVFFSSSNSKG